MSALPVVFVPFSESVQPSVGSQIAIDVKREVKEADSQPRPVLSVQEANQTHVVCSEERNEEEASTAHESMDFSEDMIRVLLDLYKSHCGQMSNSRNNSVKAMWWEKMASEFNAEFDTSFSKKRLRTKVNNLKNKLRRLEDQHRISGQGEIKIKMHKHLLDAFGNISGIATSCEESRDNIKDAEHVQGAARKLNRNSSKLDKPATVNDHEAGEDFVMREILSERLQQAENDKAKRRARELEVEKDRAKRRRAEVEEDRGHKRLAKEQEKKNVEQQITKESALNDEERRHREMMSVAQGILAALNKLVDKL